MRNHKSLKPEDIIKHGPAKIALMVASEFLRASNGSQYRADVITCYERARELMGVLETVPMDDETGSFLKPIYKECIATNLLKNENLNPEFIKRFSTRIADAFGEAASRLNAKVFHA